MSRSVRRAPNAERLHTYLEAAGHAVTPDAALFQPTRKTGKAITADGVYKCVLAYAAQARISVEGFGVHSLRATAATNASVSPRTTRFRSMNCCTNSARLPTILTLATSTIHSDDHHPTTAGHNRPLLLTLLLNLAPPSSGAFTPPLTKREVMA